MAFRSSIVLVLVSLVDGRLGSRLRELTSATFDDFMRSNPKAMIDFMDSSSADYFEDSESLKQAIRGVRDMGLDTPVGRVDFAKEPDLVRRFMEVGCAENAESQLCGAKLPHLLWFQNGEATAYSRYLRSAMNIATFIFVMDRSPVQTIEAEPEDFEFSQVVLARMPAGSPELKELEIAASKYMDSVSFLHIVSSEKNITWIANGTLVDYFMDPVDSAGIARWVQVHVAQSEDIPENAIDDGSIVVVGKTFDDLILRNDRDAILLAYAPHCGFSRKIMPVWADFARLATGSRLVVAKMDATRNRSPTPGFGLSTFPSIMYIRKGERMPILFEGANRTVEAFVEFAKSHSSEPLYFESDEAIMLQSGATEIEL